MGRRGSLGTTEGWGIKKPSKNMFQGTFMMSLFQIAGHVFSSMAIARVPVSTVHTIKVRFPLSLPSLSLFVSSRLIHSSVHENDRLSHHSSPSFLTPSCFEFDTVQQPISPYFL